MYSSFSHLERQRVRGFTIIELLVVISIIALLTSIVLTSLATARDKAVDAAIKANLANTRSEAEIFFDNGSPQSYDLVCATSGANRIGDSINAAEKAFGINATTYADGTAATGLTAQCHDSLTAWAAWAPLKGSTVAVPRGYCVDSTGASGSETVVLAGSAMVCP